MYLYIYIYILENNGQTFIAYLSTFEKYQTQTSSTQLINCIWVPRLSATIDTSALCGASTAAPYFVSPHVVASAGIFKSASYECRL